MRLENLFHFFKSCDAPTDYKVVTKVTFKRPPKKLIPVLASKGQYRKAVQRMYARVIKEGTLHLPKQCRCTVEREYEDCPINNLHI